MSEGMLKAGDRVYIDHWNFEGWGTVEFIFPTELLPIQVVIDSKPKRSIRVERKDIMLGGE